MEPSPVLARKLPLAGLGLADPAGDAVPLPHLTTVPESNVPGYHYNGWASTTAWSPGGSNA